MANKNDIPEIIPDKTKLFLALEPYSEEKERNYVCRRFLDVMAVCRQEVFFDGKKQISAVPKKTAVAELFHMSESELYDFAYENTVNIYGDYNILTQDNVPICFLTGKTRYSLCANFMLFSDWLHYVGNHFHDDFYIIPLSRHELIFVPASCGEETVMATYFFILENKKKMLENGTIKQDEMLSDSLYRYQNGQIEIVIQKTV